MALIERYNTTHGFVLLCKITLSSDELRSQLTLSEQEQSHLDTLTTDQRRREWLAWHVIVRKYVGADVTTSYDHRGAPVLCGSPMHISVSHSGDYIVLYCSETPCGIDVENVTRNFLKISSRLVSTQELPLRGCLSENDFFSIVWCAKEAMYKLSGGDFLRDMQIIELSDGKIKARLHDKYIELVYVFHDTYIVVYTK